MYEDIVMTYKSMGGNAPSVKLMRDPEFNCVRGSSENTPKLTTCPNCGAAVTHLGRCDYCNTLIR